MADGKMYLNKITGELIVRKSRLSAYKYFKADGKVAGYKVKIWHIILFRC